jgi:hypothetical protein
VRKGEELILCLSMLQLREPARHAGLYPFDALYGHGGPAHAPPNFDPRGVANPLVTPFGYPPAYDVSNLAMQQHHFGPALSSSLPPLPYQGREQNPSRPPSNPRANSYPKELGGGGGGGFALGGGGPPGMRGYPASHFPASYADLEVDRLHVQSWSKHGEGGHTTPMYHFDDDARRRTPSGPGGGGGLAESLDVVAEHHPRRSADDSKPTMNGRTLDDHMLHARSPKAAPLSHKGVNGTEHGKTGAGGRNSPSYMSIPVIPAYNPHRHQQHQQQHDSSSSTSSPHPPVLPVMVKAGPTLFGGTSGVGETFSHFGGGGVEAAAAAARATG